MERALLKIRWSVVSIAIALTLILVCPAQATWTWVQGHSGHIEYKDRFADTNRFEKGWGLDFYLNSGMEDYVHFSVPVPATAKQGVRYIRLYFYTGSVDAWVSNIIVYDGKNLIKNQAGSWSNGYQTVTVDLGSVRSFTRGLGISVLIKAGVESMSHQFVFVGAAANIVAK